MSRFLWLLLSIVLLSRGADWQNVVGGRAVAVSPGSVGNTGFTSMGSPLTGIQFTNVISESRSMTNQIYLNGSGVAAGDVDGDGLVDLFFTAIDRPCALYRNLGNWKFEDISAAAGLPQGNMDATGVVLADLDGDGDLDLVFNTVGRGTHIYINDGKGHFTKTAELNAKMGGMSLALADIDGDGDLDLYVTNYRTVTVRDEPNTRFSIKMIDGKPVVAAINGRPTTDPDLTNRFNYTFDMSGGRGSMGHEENGESDAFFRNDGKGNFTPIPIEEIFSDENGKPVTLEVDWGLSVMFRDINQDGAPDLYICNDFRSEDRLWLNDGKGHFRAAPRLALRHTSLSSMGVDFADINRDGLDDFFVADMLSRSHQRRLTQFGDVRPAPVFVGEWDNRPQYAHNAFFLNGGDGTYREISQFAGIDATEWSWSVAFLDVDLDGFEDLLVCNGFERDNLNIDVLQQMEALKGQKQLSAAEQLTLRKMFPRLATPNLAFRNKRDLHFQDMSAAWGFDAPRVSTGMALADLDNDGDLDVIINNINDPPTILRNDSAQPRIAVRVKGKGNTRGIGARIAITGGGITQSQEIISGGRYLSSDDPMRTFAALGTNMTARIRWRSGAELQVPEILPNHIYEFAEPAFTTLADAPKKPPESPIHFEDLTSKLNHTHQDELFDDFARQPLLPRKLSQLGPGVSWTDVNGDGWEDLIIGAGKGGQMAVFQNLNGVFQPLTNKALNLPITRDQTTILSLGSTLLAGSSHYEDGLPIMGGARQFDLATGAVSDAFPTQDAVTGPLALADIDGDGDLDLFRGGRCLPGKYPAPASSWIYKNNNGKFELDPEASRAFTNIGLVSGAMFADLNDDGWPDLVLACDWGPIRIFINEKGKFAERTAQLGLDHHVGWWNSVAVGDFDGDGKPDLVAGNWGLNTKYESLREKPLQVAHGDFDGDNSYDIIEAAEIPTLGKVVPIRGLDVIGKAMPLLKDRFLSHATFASASLADLVGPKPAAHPNFLFANHLETTLFLNRGGRFEAHVLPFEAQVSPVFGIVVADFDNDGAEDLFLAQNFFALPPEVSRLDAGWGVILRGDGKGNFYALTPEQSGVRVPGEQRAAAAADFDHDGRMDFVVTQNGGPTKLYRNTSAGEGLRVKLRGGPQNQNAIGATFRVANGPVHTIQSGSGYWSLDSTTKVVPKPADGALIEVRWPGGAVTKSSIPATAREITVSADGKVDAHQ